MSSMDLAFPDLLEPLPLRAHESKPRVRPSTFAKTMCSARTAIAPTALPSNADSAAPELNDILEDQIRRIAHSLHDEAGQLLAAIHIKLDQMVRALPDEQAAALECIKPMLEAMETQLRGFSHELRPLVLDDLGLAAGVELLRKGVAQRTGLAIVAEVNVPLRLPARLETVLYRIVQEALETIAAKRGTKRARISIEMECRSVHCSIWHDGAPDMSDGCEPLDAQLRSIRERVEELAGGVRVVSARGRGQEIAIAVPVERCAALAACA
jgi:signal transduction histidine kinase